MQGYEKPIPAPDHGTDPFWKAAKQGRLLLQRCPACGAHQFFPQPDCRACLSDSLDWVESNGRGLVYSYTIVYRPPGSAFEPDVPYTVALIDLSEGCRLLSNVVDVNPQDIRVGMPVKVVFEEITPDISLPKFRPL